MTLIRENRPYLSVEMQFQNKYETNADYLCSFERLRQLRKTGLIEKVKESSKGHVIFKFKDSDLRVELSNKGILLIYWHSEEEKEKFYPFLPAILATVDGSPVTINGLTSTVYNIPKGTKMFTIAWCKEKISYFRNLGLWNYLKWRRMYNDEMREKEILELDVEGFALYDELHIKEYEAEDKLSPEERIKRRQKYRKLLSC